ncbi:hypothetical protein [Kistimonas scapharcae]|uniref:hypothetical protein n=1 Tax=Kistimonas scapharcae TaxID=1036133 RepID=UPI0031F09C9B
MQLFRFFMLSLTLLFLPAVSSTLHAAPLTASVTISLEQILKAASQESTANAQNRHQMPAQDFVARQARLIVNSLAEESELLNYPSLYTQRMLSEYRHQ